MAEGEDAAVVSPKYRVKFLCSHGGKIMLRPPDGQLKYVGGETRVVAIPRDITFSDLMKKKLSTLSEGNGEVTLKYQVIPEDLDTLVSVTCDEDLHNMLSEHDRQDTKSPELNGSPRLRAFLFPSNPTTLDNQINPNDPHLLEQHYINAINGITRPPTLRMNLRRSSSNGGRPIFSICSPGSSPKGYSNGYTIDTINQEAFLTNTKEMMPRVNSSPSLYNLGHQNPYNFPHHQQAYYHSPRLLPAQVNNVTGNARISSALSMGSNDYGNGRLPSALSVGSNDYGNGGKVWGMGSGDYGGRVPVAHHPLPRYCSPTRHRGSSRGSGEGSIGYGHIDECGVYRSSGGGGVEMLVNLPQNSMGP